MIIKIYVIESNVTGQYYKHLHGVAFKWVDERSEATHLSSDEMYKVVSDLDYFGFDVVGRVDRLAMQS